MIVKMDIQQVEEVSRLAKKLWPSADYDHLLEEFSQIAKKEDEICFLLYEKEEAIGFVHASTRYDYVEGTEESPVGYIEGIYIEEGHRRKGHSAKLIDLLLRPVEYPFLLSYAHLSFYPIPSHQAKKSFP
jgi:aminoglycoside 6'-N-acetyltransferase I